MKYCPYCGAALPDSAVSFCPECGKSMPESTSGTTMPDKPVKEKKSRKNAKKKKVTPPRRSKTEPPPEDDYDGYYDDRKCFFCISLPGFAKYGFIEPPPIPPAAD